MEKFKVCQNFAAGRYSDKALDTLACNVVKNLTRSEVYPTLGELAAQIGEVEEKFADALLQMLDPNKQATTQKNQIRKQLETLLRSAALKVQDLSEGDELMIRKSGFDITEKAAPIGILPQVTNVKAKAGSLAGSLEISWDVVVKAIMYEVRYAVVSPDGTTEYISVLSTRHKIILEGLEAGKQYRIIVSAIGTDSRRTWSGEIVSPYVS